MQLMPMKFAATALVVALVVVCVEAGSHPHQALLAPRHHHVTPQVVKVGRHDAALTHHGSTSVEKVADVEDQAEAEVEQEIAVDEEEAATQALARKTAEAKSVEDHVVAQVKAVDTSAVEADAEAELEEAEKEAAAEAKESGDDEKDAGAMDEVAEASPVELPYADTEAEEELKKEPHEEKKDDELEKDHMAEDPEVVDDIAEASPVEIPYTEPASKKAVSETEEEEGKKAMPKEHAMAKSNKTNVTEMPPPPEMPFDYMYKNPDQIAHDVEYRRGPTSENEQHATDSMFLENPDVFSKCVLVRDFAEPLRVSSNLVEQAATLSGRKHRNHRYRHNASISTAPISGGAEPTVPAELLHLDGGVLDRTAGKDGAELKVNMFAWLSSVAGEVQVIPNGIISKWSSKKKVPVAGYLCVGPNGPVLHTLTTPCLATALDDNGEPSGPPGTNEPTAAPAGAAPAPVAATSLLSRRQSMAPAPAPPMAVMPGSPEAAPAPAPAGPGAPNYRVWVGNVELFFSSQPEGRAFCRRLAEEIAEDLGDSTWDTFDASPQQQQDPTIGSFVQMSRKEQPSWTTGTKSLLVAVMDWEFGDNTRAPMSAQSKSPMHYESRVFPRVVEAFKRMSFGKLDLKVTVIPEVVRYTRKRARYAVGRYPFPALYNAAQESLEGNRAFNSEYNFDDYDLAFVIAPQTAPTGTKGAAWIGAKGAMCNGCETLSENFQVMAAVHELGHNLGLFHASSQSLEYGNVFDWMGNYPDVMAHSFGIGYKMMLNWLPQTSVARVTDLELANLNDEYLIKPFDDDVYPAAGELVGVRISLKDSERDVYISYRQSAGEEAGVYLTLQDKHKPSSELIDAACHTPSQRDARLRPGWTYIDQTQQVVIYVAHVDAQHKVARVRAYRAPSSDDEIAAIRGRATFTDGSWKCPRTCQDSDLLVSMMGSCSGLKSGGYCSDGSVAVGGQNFAVGMELCPQSCGMCGEVMEGTTLRTGGCADRPIKIGGRTCQEAASAGLCGAGTSLGNVGIDLCPRSCGQCPPAPRTSHTGKTFQDPSPQRTHGAGGSVAPAAAAPVAVASPAPAPAEAEVKAEEAEEEATEAEEEHEAEVAEKAELAMENGESSALQTIEGEHCTDDPAWTDSDGDTCAVYAKTIEDGKMTVEAACEYNDGAAKPYCRKTCGECEIHSGNCQDKTCVTKWHKESGRCFSCPDYPSFCEMPWFAADCPRTCDMCTSDVPVTTPPLPTTPFPATTTTTTTTTTAPITTPAPCEDQQCVAHWQKDFNKCFKCADYAADFCGTDERFSLSCPLSCKMCATGDAAPKCEDIFAAHTCRRYQEFGWCTQYAHISDNCKATCGVCHAEEVVIKRLREAAESGASAPALSAAVFGALVAALVGRCW